MRVIIEARTIFEHNKYKQNKRNTFTIDEDTTEILDQYKYVLKAENNNRLTDAIRRSQ